MRHRSVQVTQHSVTQHHLLLGAWYTKAKWSEIHPVFSEKPSHNDVWRNWGIATRILNPNTIAGYFSASRSGSLKPCETTPEQEAA